MTATIADETWARFGGTRGGRTNASGVLLGSLLVYPLHGPFRLAAATRPRQNGVLALNGWLERDGAFGATTRTRRRHTQPKGNVRHGGKDLDGNGGPRRNASGLRDDERPMAVAAQMDLGQQRLHAFHGVVSLTGRTQGRRVAGWRKGWRHEILPILGMVVSPRQRACSNQHKAPSHPGWEPDPSW